MKDKVIIIGGKGTAVVIAEQIIDASLRFGAEVEVLGFAFDDPSFGADINGLPILCKTYEAYSLYKTYEDVKFIFQLYRSDLLRERIELRNNLMIPMKRFYKFIHPSAYIARSAAIGEGCVILANSVVNCNAVIGDFNTLNSNVLIGHDTVIGDNNFFAGHTCVGSGLSIGNGNFFGLNSTLKNLVQIEDYNLIGMASNVVKNVGSDTTLIGNPARELKK